VSVTDQINEPRYPSFKGIMAAKKKAVETWSLADLGISADQVGLDAAWSQVTGITKRPPRTKGTVVSDDGTAVGQLVDFLAANRFV
jgi:electron transfer flavoprotein beta subunit